MVKLQISSLFLPGYTIYRLDRQSRGGGVMILVKNKFNAEIENTILTAEIELLHIALELPYTKPINIVSVYRPPSASLSVFISDFTNFLNNIPYNHLPLVIMGDLNINVLNKKNSAYLQLGVYRIFGIRCSVSGIRLKFNYSVFGFDNNLKTEYRIVKIL